MSAVSMQHGQEEASIGSRHAGRHSFAVQQFLRTEDPKLLRSVKRGLQLRQTCPLVARHEMRLLRPTHCIGKNLRGVTEEVFSVLISPGDQLRSGNLVKLQPRSVTADRT